MTIESLDDEIAGRGFKLLEGSRVYVTERVYVTKDYIPGTLPIHFLVLQYDRDTLRAVEHQINFPIENPDQFIEALKAIDVIYSRIQDPISHLRYGLEADELRRFFPNSFSSTPPQS